MRILLVTEKYNPQEHQRDGGATLIRSLVRAFGNSLTIMQFGSQQPTSGNPIYLYPYSANCRFKQRLFNADYIGQKVYEIQSEFTHIIFVHISMQFGIINFPIHNDIKTWTFPMFLTPSYLESGEEVPIEYTALERLVLEQAQNIITPSRLEKQQIINFYNVAEDKIHIIPRGIDVTCIKPQIRCCTSQPIFCSIGSIKPQKNTLGLIQLFSDLHHIYPNARLRIIGPVQNQKYAQWVREEIQRLRIEDQIEYTGYITPQEMPHILKDCHLHLSMATCETFGRAIFESLAAGLPNVARKSGNAAAEYLEHLPYARFIDDKYEMIREIKSMLKDLDSLSSMAIEIGELYNDVFLSQMIVAKILKAPVIAISDFDGTLYHKDDSSKTSRSVEAFKKYPVRVVCSARALDDILTQLQKYELEVDWIIGYGGSLIAKGCGEVQWAIPFEPNHLDYLNALFPQAHIFAHDNQPIQIALAGSLSPAIPGYRIERYKDETFISNWKASKFHAVQRILRHMNWQGQVAVFGDGPYDLELITYFDGIRVTPSPNNNREQKEVVYVS